MGFVLIRHSPVEHRRVFFGSKIIGLVCKGETVGKIGEVNEMGERELVPVVSVGCGKGRDKTVDDNCFKDTKMCNPELCSS